MIYSFNYKRGTQSFDRVNETLNHRRMGNGKICRIVA